MTPDKHLAASEQEQERRVLDQIRAKLSPNEIEQIIDQSLII